MFIIPIWICWVQFWFWRRDCGFKFELGPADRPATKKTYTALERRSDSRCHSALMEILSIILLMVFSPDWLISVPLSGVCRVYILGGIFAWTLKQWLAVGLSLAEVKFKRSYWIKCNWRFVHSNIRVWLRLFSTSLVIFSLFSKFFGDLTGFSVISLYLKWLPF